jgi:hypothetical protein
VAIPEAKSNTIGAARNPATHSAIFAVKSLTPRHANIRPHTVAPLTH